MTSSANQAATGVSGLDDVLQGGLSRGHLFLLEGEPGAGKTTIALQFLIEGAKTGEKCLYITLSETESELRDGARSHGWTLGPEISVFELIPPESLLDSEQQQSLLYRLPGHPIGARQIVLDQSRVGRQVAVDNFRNDSVYNLFHQGWLGLELGHAFSEGFVCAFLAPQRNKIHCFVFEYSI